MPLHIPHHKIQQTHLDRYCLIYIRQSSWKQVLKNTASTARQYDFHQRAMEYGWPPEKIIIIDEDQGVTGSVFGDRAGFRQVFEEVSRGLFGAVCSIELCRLSRDDSDFAQMVSNCRWTDTLLIDEDGVYDPKDPNDKLLLGIKGSLSSAELHAITARLVGGMRKRASQGALRIALPAGYIYEPVTKAVIFDPDPEVQRVIRLFFDLFDEIGTAYGVHKEFERRNQLFPSRSRRHINHGKLQWRPLFVKLAMDTLHNPDYAGAYAYGRKKTEYSKVPGELLKFKARQVPVKRSEWRVLILDHHPGYITWKQYEVNEGQLEANQTDLFEGRRGLLGPGSALLQGIAICGHCGRRLQIKYPRGNYSLYACLNKGCHTFTGESSGSVSVDKEVACALLKALEPAQLMMSLDTLKQVEAKAQESDRQLKQRESAPPVINEENRQAILALAQDVPRFWLSPTTSNAQRKTLLRFLIEDVTLSRDRSTVHIKIRWRTKACTHLSIAIPNNRMGRCATPLKVINKIRELAPDHTDRRIAEILNTAGMLSGKKRKFTLVAIRHIRFNNKIKTGCPEIPTNRLMLQRGDGLFTPRGAAEKLNISTGTVLVWCKNKILPTVQSKEKSAYWIELTPETVNRLRKPVRQVHRRKNVLPQLSNNEAVIYS